MFVHTQRERCKTVVIACGGRRGQEVLNGPPKASVLLGAGVALSALCLLWTAQPTPSAPRRGFLNACYLLIRFSSSFALVAPGWKKELF